MANFRELHRACDAAADGTVLGVRQTLGLRQTLPLVLCTPGDETLFP